MISNILNFTKEIINYSKLISENEAMKDKISEINHNLSKCIKDKDKKELLIKDLIEKMENKGQFEITDYNKLSEDDIKTINKVFKPRKKRICKSCRTLKDIKEFETFELNGRKNVRYDCKICKEEISNKF